jgi:superfamily II DNA/RNA helicase
LEQRGLLPRIGVDIHPGASGGPAGFVGQAVLTIEPLDAAYQEAEHFTRLLSQRTRSAGFLRSLLLQRMCSSIASGQATATRLLEREMMDDDEDALFASETLSNVTPEERACLERMLRHLSTRTSDPKLDMVLHYLLGSPRWLEQYGCIVFSQYYDTARWVADHLAQRLPNEPVAVYAGADRSGIYRGGAFTSVPRDEIKGAVRRRDLRLVIATDAACEGLNLQTLGSLINVDLPWNPSRLEQRIGRIKRFGQARASVDVLNLVYAGTLDEQVYSRLSRRMRNRYDVFGSLPDVIEDDWIENIEKLDQRLDEYIERRKAGNAFELRYGDTIDPDGEPWERCQNVLARRDILEHLSRGW